MIDRTHPLSLTKQATAARISRGSVYYLPKPVSTADLALMRRIDVLHLEHPFAGARMLRDLLAQENVSVGRKPNTSRRHAKHLIYPYLLRTLKVERPNQVWAMDISVPQEAA